MYGVIGEDESDVLTLKVIIKRLANNQSLSVRTKAYSGCGELLRKGSKQLRLFAEMGCTKLIACYDSDRDDPLQRRQQLIDLVVKPSGLADHCCAVIPVQELEAWILADICAVTNLFTSWKPVPIKTDPELIRDPKEALIKLSRAANNRPRYVTTIHNEQVAAFLDLRVLAKRCKAFVDLEQFVTGNRT